MADASEYYTYLSTIRIGFSDYVVAHGVGAKVNGIKSDGQQRKLVQLNIFTSCMDVMNHFEPTSTVHMFTALEMGDWMSKINQLLNETYYVDFSQYY